MIARCYKKKFIANDSKASFSTSSYYYAKKLVLHALVSITLKQKFQENFHVSSKNVTFTSERCQIITKTLACYCEST